MIDPKKYLRTSDHLEVDWHSPDDVRIDQFKPMRVVFHTDTWLVLKEPSNSMLWVFEKIIRSMGGGPEVVIFRFCFTPNESQYGFEALYAHERYPG